MEVTTNPELDYLRYIYNSIDSTILVELYNKCPIQIPKKYNLVICKDCDEDLAENICFLCNKLLCVDCVYYCKSYKIYICKEHFLSCPICGSGCTCDYCSKYLSDDICSQCSEQVSYGIHCGCVKKKEKHCGMCEKRMDTILKET
tara:strand:- start:139 stop:573 length:435 start_codon:yes stop_codon:yes gene_type:complete